MDLISFWELGLELFADFLLLLLFVFSAQGILLHVSWPLGTSDAGREYGDAKHVHSPPGRLCRQIGNLKIPGSCAPQVALNVKVWAVEWGKGLTFTLRQEP